MVKAMILIALQPMAQGFSKEKIEYAALVAKSFAEIYMENIEHMYSLIFFSVGFAVGSMPRISTLLCAWLR